MERSNHFFAQNRARGRGQKLRNPGGTAGRLAKRNPRQGEGNSNAVGEPRWPGDRRREASQAISKNKGQNRKATIRFTLKTCRRPNAFAAQVTCRMLPPGTWAFGSQEATRRTNDCESRIA